MMPSMAAVKKAPRIDASPPTATTISMNTRYLKREIRVEPDDLDRQRAAQPGEPAADRERHREHAVDVQTQPARHALIVDAGANLRAESRVVDPSDHAPVIRSAATDQEQAIYTEAEVADCDAAAHICRQFHRLLRGSENDRPPTAIDMKTIPIVSND